MLLPPLDLAVSPRTGYTRAHWLAAADGLLAPAQPFASPGHALISLPGRPSQSGPRSDGLEGFARTFLLLSLRVRGADGEDPAGLLQAYADGLAHGVDAAHPEAWPRIDADCRQTIVEACSIVLGLQLTRPWLWDGLSSRTQEQAVAWLTGASGLEIPDNNWHLFRVAVDRFLRSVGAPLGAAEIERDVARIEEFYVGDGWFRDGGDAQTSDRFDHYCGWAMHTYPALLDHLFGDIGQFPETRPRLRRFLEDYVHLVGADGAPMHQGRSLIYRFAAAAAPWTGALVGATPLEPGLTRRLASGMLRHFVDRGFTTPDGVPSLGWYQPFSPMVQSYSAPASPYWLAKGFIGLLLPADHPCWVDREADLPVERADQQASFAAPGFTISATRSDGVVRLSNHGSDNHATLSSLDDPHYSRLAYSSATAPMLGVHDSMSLADNHIGLIDSAGALSRRSRIHRTSVSGSFAASWHEPMWPDGSTGPGRIDTVVVSAGPWELRCHRIEAPAELDVFESGWQLASDDPPPKIDDAVVRAAGLTSALLPLAGHDGSAQVVQTESTSAFGRYAATPLIRSVRGAPVTYSAALVGLGADLDRGKAAAEVVDGRIEATLPDGRPVRVEFKHQDVLL
ncbi:DUF2264 domain-containing protein [Luteipulveratus mongoliensis]|uniref:DUF2264 domain-containing protein n=1 Tax=Luteipulveratus mongoliensis TaxID=571913 RepID=A0A0K1JFZ9_9MICO|nr:DUF2264 domain-containing protein [Luteipulveratus mongoliensis]AKU15629.1 hypothetical protein VV02_06805 [Luteipulveratus mongoliensis]